MRKINFIDVYRGKNPASFYVPSRPLDGGLHRYTCTFYTADLTRVLRRRIRHIRDSKESQGLTITYDRRKTHRL